MQQKKANPQHQSLVIKLYIRPEQQVEIILNSYSNSSIDGLIQECIHKYKLKQQAHLYLKQQIYKHLAHYLRGNSNFCQSQPSVGDSFGLGQQPLRKKQVISAHLKIRHTDPNRIPHIDCSKLGQIDQNKVTFQKTPKNAQKKNLKKEHLLITKKSKKSPGMKKSQSQKQNIQPLLFEKTYSPLSNQKRIIRSQRHSMLSNKSASKTKKDSKDTVIIKSDDQICREDIQFLENQHLFSPVKDFRIKTETSVQGPRLKQISLRDLEREMQTQMDDLKLQKKISKVEKQLCSLFRSIIRYNPPKVNRIDPRYACFEDLSQRTIKCLHQFLTNLKDEELQCLDFQNFKKYLIKYRGNSLLQSLE